ncbi:MAG: hypothetical protein RMZ42_07940 [Nostoc sp. DedQUE05]|uniref:hypothetical protein n=1 Tax=Nostoc sp. DedQUE05 TaxID=3075391 RepID=UPI002AD2CA77|nr:hypothetical protein [Nostoc sp. DedQUE05]MDZ8091861.1 hypothetical protein [Nostoc sp. DedQUE05]
MLELHKSYVIDDNQQPIAVQIPIAEFEKIEEILEDYGLAKLIDEVEEEKPLSKDEALQYYQSLKEENVAS